ncbi:MAG: octanoyltransferase [Isosphaera sp.]|nr:octanoyltransferase [Isosphaera sp.]
MTDPQHDPARALSAYLLGTLGFDALLALQRRLVYEAGGPRPVASLVVCDHPPGITVGREGSRAHIRPSPEQLHARGWPVRWVGRGGGVMLHLPGQVACYPVLPLAALGLTPAGYVAGLQAVGVDLLRWYGVTAEPDPDRPGVRANGRRVAHLGVAVRGGATCFGLVVNTDPDLRPFRDVRCDGDPAPMTSIARESSHRVTVPGVRQRFVELVAARWGFDRISLFHQGPGALPRPTPHAAAHRP